MITISAMMISTEQALQIICQFVKVLPEEKLKLSDCLDRVLAEDVYAEFDIPALDNSAMDGYAVRREDTLGASRENPKVLAVIESIRAGFLPQQSVGKKQAIKITTGAALPAGCDSVVMVEDTKSKEQRAKSKEFIEIFKAVKIGENVRRKAEDIKKGELVLSRGSLLRPADIGILASLGQSAVKVTRKPKVAILATGDEIIDLNDELKEGKLYSSNSYSLYAQVIKSGGMPKNLGIVSDNVAQLAERISQGFDCDLIITSGGVSMGDYDLVKAVLENMGAQIKFWKVAIKPGKPLLFGLLKGIPVFGLPGNPVSSMVVFEIFLRPALIKMIGQNSDIRKEVEAVLEEDITKKKGFTYFLRAQTRWENSVYLTRTTGPQGSGILKSMCLANSLIILPQENDYIEKGKRVKVRFLD